MSIATGRSAPSRPGWMESHRAHGALAHPGDVLQKLEPRDLNERLCTAARDGDKRPLSRTDEETYRLHLVFLHAHGAPKGEFTTFISASAMTGGLERADARETTAEAIGRSACPERVVGLMPNLLADACGVQAK